MRDFFARQRENLFVNLLASFIFAGLAIVVAWLSALPPVLVPAWMFFGGLAAVAAWWWLSRPRKKLAPIVNEAFGVERVYVDGKHFADCKFIGSELVFQGKEGFSLKGCELVPPRFAFEESAGVVLNQLVVLNQAPEFRPFVERALNQKS